MAEHTWDLCSMCGPMVRCGHCGNNCCNGGSPNGCPDECASAYAMQDAKSIPYELLAEWETRRKPAGHGTSDA